MTQSTADFTDQIPRVDVSTLTDEQRAEARNKHDRLFAWLAQYPRDNSANGGLMLSRHNDAQMWEATGFHVVVDTGVVNAKVGRHPYQPIGWDDGQHFVPMTHSQMLWRRQFAIASLREIPSCFSVEETGYRPPAGVDDSLNDADRASMQEALDVLRDRLAIEDQGSSGDRLSLLDTLKLAVLQTPRLDRYLTAQEEAFRAQHESDLMDVAVAGGALPRVVFGLTEWLDMKLQEDEVRRTVEGTILKVPDVTPEAIQGVWLDQINTALAGTDTQAAAATLNFLRRAAPSLQGTILKGLEDQKTAHEILEACRAALTPAPATTQEVTPESPAPQVDPE